MAHVHILPADRIGKDFIPAEFLPKGKDEYYLRNTQFDKSGIVTSPKLTKMPKVDFYTFSAAN